MCLAVLIRSAMGANSSKEVIGYKEQDKPLAVRDLAKKHKVELCSQQLVRLTEGVGVLNNLTTLRLCCNHLTTLPDEIGQLRTLKRLYLSRNRLQYIPDSIGELVNLVELKMDSNALETLPASIGNLSQLVLLTANTNHIKYLPPEIGNLKKLVSLELKRNPLSFVPAEIGRLKCLRKFRLEDCPLLTDFEPSAMSIPTLKELAGRAIIRHNIRIHESLPEHLVQYLHSARTCTFCMGPYFDCHVLRIKFVTKYELRIPMVYTLCIPHWNTDNERISQMFMPPPYTAPRVLTPKARVGAVRRSLSHGNLPELRKPKPVPSIQSHMNLASSEQPASPTGNWNEGLRSARSLSFLPRPAWTGSN